MSKYPESTKDFASGFFLDDKYGLIDAHVTNLLEVHTHHTSNAYILRNEINAGRCKHLTVHDYLEYIKDKDLTKSLSNLKALAKVRIL